MMRALVAYTATLCLYSGVRGQPIACQNDDQCQSGFYCVQDAFVCQRCLNCEELKRDPPRAISSCIKSIAKCGSCIKGFVEDLRGDVSAQCVLPDIHDGDSQPAYVWVAVAVGLALFVLMLIVTAVYSLRNINTLKIMASTRASVQPQCAGGGPAGAAGAAGVAGAAGPSAPELPPAYEAHYSARPASPAPLLDYSADHGSDESSWPFIKRAASAASSPGGQGGQAREAAGSQAARVFNHPHYVRGAHLPHAAHALDYSAAGEQTDEAGEAGAAGAEGAGLAAAGADERDVFTLDEDTTESTWTPAPPLPAAGGTGGIGGDGPASGALVAARGPLCTRQGTDSGRNAGEPLGTGEGTANGPPSAPSFIINVLQNINAVQQQTNVTL